MKMVAQLVKILENRENTVQIKMIIMQNFLNMFKLINNIFSKIVRFSVKLVLMRILVSPVKLQM